MGGVNHQPCRKYLRNSTKLSRQVSLVTVGLETANIQLEDVILAEIDGSRASLNSVMNFLCNTQQDLQIALSICKDLREQMETEKYQDLPTLRTVNLEEVGNDLALNGLVENGAWRKMSRMMKDGTFYANLSYFEQELSAVAHDIQKLNACFKALSQENVLVSQVAEKNLAGNFKETFAQLFTHWLRFHQEFLASSLVSTEVYYASFNAGSLVRNKQQGSDASAA